MTRPGPEGDLNGIVGQVNNLREQRGVAGQTDAEYRATITNYRDGLLAIYSQPDVQAILETERKHDFPPRLGYFYYGVDRMGKRLHGPGFTEERDHHHAVDYFGNLSNGGALADFFNVNLDVKKTPDGDFDFVVESPISLFTKRHGPTAQPIFTLSLDKLEDLLQLTPGSTWVGNNSKNYGSDTFLKKLSIEDFMRHPEWLERFDTALTTALDRAQAKTTAQTKEQQRRIAQFSGTPVEQVAERLRAGVQYSNDALNDVAKDGAETALEQTPPLPAGVSEERVRAIVAEMITERLAALQATPERQVVAIPSPQIEETMHQIAQGDPVAESIMRRFVRRSKDPQKVTQALLELSALIPGSSQISAILKAVNTMFGPEETTR